MIKKILVTSIALFVIGCSTTQGPPKETPDAANSLQQAEFEEGNALYKKKKFPLALKKLASFAQKYPKSELSDDALNLMAQIYHEQNDYHRAAKYWLMVTDGKIESQFYESATLNAATDFSQVGRTDEALQTIQKFRVTRDTEPTLAARGLELAAKLKIQKGFYVEAMKDLIRAAQYKQNNQDKQLLFSQAGELVSSLNQKQLDEVLSDKNLQDYEPQARFRLAMLMFDQKSYSSARKQYEYIIEKYPNTEYAKRAQSYLNNIEAQERVETNTIGIVLPLSGKFSQTGYKALHGIQFAADIFNRSNSSGIKLAIADSEGNPDIARRGVEKLVREDHVVAIIGDIMSKSAQAVATKSQELGIPCITLSQKQDLTEIGEFIFRANMTPDTQMKNLVHYSMSTRGYKKFAILYPNDSYGTEYATAFWDYVLLNGGQITAAQTYNSEETDFRDPVRRLLGMYYEEDRAKEYQIRMNDWKKDQAKRSSREKLPNNLLPPVADFDAVFIPDSPKAVGQIAPMLAFHDVDKMPLLGTNLWNSQQTALRGGRFVENALFMDDFFPEDPTSSMKKFLSDFQNQFGQKPDVFEAQAYDSANLIIQALKSSNFSLSRLSLRDKLSEATNIVGASGHFKMTPLREVEKSLTPLTIQKGLVVKSETGRGQKP